jgi:hypothetical protein
MTVEPLDPAFVSEALSQKPWLGIDGVINARDLGNLPIAGDPSKITKPYMLLRTAELSGITPRGNCYPLYYTILDLVSLFNEAL